MQTQQQGRGGNGQQRGVQGRPDVKAREKFGEERVREILQDRKQEILALFANDPRPEAMYDRATGLACGAYKKAQDDENDSANRQRKSPRRIDEVSAVACCIWSMQRKLDPGIDVYFVPYGGKLTPIISPEGVIKLLFRTGLVRAINARYVFHGEEFDYELGSKQWVKHKKNNVRPLAAKVDYQVAENRAEWNLLAYAYAIIDLKDGGQIIEVLDKADISYFRSLSPTGESQYGGWAKFPAAFGRKAALKQAAKFAPKDSEVSVILTSDDTERGIEIPDEIMKAVGARILNEMTGESAAPSGDTSEPPPNTQHSKKPSPQPGDPKKLAMPGTPPQPSIAEATDDALIASDKRGRAAFDANKWPEQYFDKNAIQLATIRAQMRERGLVVPPHPFFDAGLPSPAAEPPQEQVYDYGEREPGMEG